MNTLKILSVGNSFSVDTMEYLASVALHAGYSSVFLGNLYVGGCSVQKHYHFAENDLPAYTYYYNDGFGWQETCNMRISDAVTSENWDYISIQHGTADGSFYSDPACYEKLPGLITYVKSLAPHAKIAFNMTWVGEPDFPHHEIRAFHGDTALLFQKILELTKTHLRPLEGLDRVSPTGLAIQIARTSYPLLLTRDGFHLSYGLGRYIASLTFLQALTEVAISSIDWAPDGVSEEEKRLALDSARQALEQFG